MCVRAERVCVRVRAWSCVRVCVCKQAQVRECARAACSSTRTPTHIQTNKHARTRTHTRTLAHTRIHPRARADAHARAHIRAHAHAVVHSGTKSLPSVSTVSTPYGYRAYSTCRCASTHGRRHIHAFIRAHMRACMDARTHAYIPIHIYV